MHTERRSPCPPPCSNCVLQIGIEMHRAFLRALHPLQVVELPRQAPGPALQLFARVAAHVRVLVVGGDGSGRSLDSRKTPALPILRCRQCYPATQLACRAVS